MSFLRGQYSTKNEKMQGLRALLRAYPPQGEEAGYAPKVMDSIDTYQRVANKFKNLTETAGVFFFLCIEMAEYS